MLGRFRNGLFAAVASSVLVPSATLADDKPAMSYSFNVAITSDYIFRGVSQTARAPTGQAGLDLTYGKFYAGVWGSGLDFGNDTGTFRNTARGEVDIYAGFKPEWNKITFDFGLIYYAYPRALDNRATTLLGGEADYVELKAGMSREVWTGGTLSSTLFFSPDYTNSSGRVITTETQFAQVFPLHGSSASVTLSALLGSQYGRDQRYLDNITNGDKKYMYWNAGMTLGWEKFSFDVRYWDTNIKNNGTINDFCTSKVFECDQRVVGTVKFTY